MQIRFLPYTLHLKRTFAISSVSRTLTPAVLVELRHEGVCGYGEASLPPYRSETTDSVIAFLRKVPLKAGFAPDDLPELLQEIEALPAGNQAARAAVEMALHDWVGKMLRFSWIQRWKLSADHIRPTSFTIGLATTDEIRTQVREAAEFESLKVKLGGERDKEVISAIVEMTHQKIRVDVNQGWSDRSEALAMIEWLAERGVELVEQPLPKEKKDDLRWLRERSPLPLMADEGVETSSDLLEVAGLYHGINVKLMKSGGMAEAYQMMTEARRLGLQVMIGCMTETSCAISAAAQLAPLADWVDLDGALLIRNDPFEGAFVQNGRIQIPHRFGNGVEPTDTLGKGLAWISL